RSGLAARATPGRRRAAPLARSRWLAGRVDAANGRNRIARVWVQGALMRRELCWLGLAVGALLACTTASSTTTKSDGSTTTTTTGVVTAATTGTSAELPTTTGSGLMSTSEVTTGTTGEAVVEELLVCDFGSDDVRRYDAATG